MWNQRNSKVTEDYLKKLKLKLENQNDLTAAELKIQLLSETGINITERRIQQILKDVGFTKKKKHFFMRMHFFQSIYKEQQILFILMILNLQGHLLNTDHYYYVVVQMNQVLIIKQREKKVGQKSIKFY
jgi:hypothetical protein